MNPWAAFILLFVASFAFSKEDKSPLDFAEISSQDQVNEGERIPFMNLFQIKKVVYSGEDLYDHASKKINSFRDHFDIEVIYHAQDIDLRVSADTNIQNTTDDSSTAGKSTWTNEIIISDVGVGARKYVNSFLFVGLGIGLGVSISVENNDFTSVKVDRVFSYQELGFNLNTSENTYFSFVSQLNIGKKIADSQFIGVSRDKIVDGAINTYWNYSF